jgi:hypothetical protein
MGKGREPQIVLKTEQGTVALGHWRQGEISAKSNGWDENRIFSSRATSSRSRSKAAKLMIRSARTAVPE